MAEIKQVLTKSDILEMAITSGMNVYGNEREILEFAERLAASEQAPELKHVMSFKRVADQTVELTFTSCRAAADFEILVTGNDAGASQPLPDVAAEREKLLKIADWLDANTDTMQDTPEQEPDYPSHFDWEMAQAAEALRDVAAALQPEAGKEGA